MHTHPNPNRYMTSYSANEIFTSVARLGVILSLGSMLVTGFLHGDMMAFAGAGLQYWFMQPVFYNILQVLSLGPCLGGEGGGCRQQACCPPLDCRPLAFVALLSYL